MATPPLEDHTPAEPPAQTPAGRFSWSNVEFRKRVISAVVLAPVVLGCIAWGGAPFYGMMILVAIFMMREWDALTAHRNSPYWGIAGVIYVCITCLSLIILRVGAEGESVSLLLFLLAVIWATDIGAYFTGKQLGGPKLAPGISPGKTWSGLLGGILSAVAIGCLLAWFFPFPQHFLQAAWISTLLAIVAQAGDLFESWMKRQAGMKDSSNLIPGHGGMLDRVDGFTFSAPLLVVLHWLLTVPAPAAM